MELRFEPRELVLEAVSSTTLLNCLENVFSEHYHCTRKWNKMLNKKIDPVLVLKEQIIWWGRLLINLLQTKVKVKLSLRPQRGTALTKRAIYLKKERERVQLGRAWGWANVGSLGPGGRGLSLA